MLFKRLICVHLKFIELLTYKQLRIEEKLKAKDKKKPEVRILMSDKTDFKTKPITKDKEDFI